MERQIRQMALAGPAPLDPPRRGVLSRSRLEGADTGGATSPTPWAKVPCAGAVDSRAGTSRGWRTTSNSSPWGLNITSKGRGPSGNVASSDFASTSSSCRLRSATVTATTRLEGSNAQGARAEVSASRGMRCCRFKNGATPLPARTPLCLA